MWKFITILFMLSPICLSERRPIVKTELGAVEGFYMRTRDGRKVSAFTAMPYAQPPLGDLRFQAPLKVKPWKNVLDASQPTPVCVQRNPYTRQKEIVGQEDCLYLNVYSPDVTDKLLPVMLFFHGGGWMCGDSTTYMYGPEFLLDKDVVLVTTNYRLGPLGFLSTQDEHCPGNNGLKDQQEALRWIQKHIHNFGGDNSSVTIFGESAGGASVHFHMLSSTSKGEIHELFISTNGEAINYSEGLFHKAISESGTALVPWAESSPGETVKNTFRVARLMDCPQAPSEAMIKCLRTKDSYEIIDTEFKLYVWDYEPMTPFKAVVEPNLPGAFITEAPRELAKNPPNKVPWLTGLNEDEGCLKSVWITSNASRYEEFVSAIDVIAPVTYYYESSPYLDKINKVVKEHYFSEPDNFGKGILEAYSDSYFAYPLVEAVELMMKSKIPIYLYNLAYRATNSFSQIFGDPTGDYGVCHADELMHLFPIHFLKHEFSKQDIDISRLIITLWTNFATSGNPNLPTKVNFKWHPATSAKSMEHLIIAKNTKMGTNLGARSRLWGTLPLWHNIPERKINDEL